jgi:hypothetical protein
MTQEAQARIESQEDNTSEKEDNPLLYESPKLPPSWQSK